MPASHEASRVKLTNQEIGFDRPLCWVDRKDALTLGAGETGPYLTEVPAYGAGEPTPNWLVRRAGPVRRPRAGCIKLETLAAR